MSGFLLDTNVLSSIGDPNPDVKQWLETTAPEALNVSVLTLAEIRFGIELLSASRRRTHLEKWLARDLPPWFGSRV